MKIATAEAVKVKGEVAAVRRNRRGQTMTEYAIIVALIALACIAAIKVVGEQAGDTFARTGQALGDANTDAE